MNTSLEILQADIDARRSVISKLDGWVRQGEVTFSKMSTIYSGCNWLVLYIWPQIWRADIESQLAEVSKQLRSLDRNSKEQQVNILANPSIRYQWIISDLLFAY